MLARSAARLAATHSLQQHAGMAKFIVRLRFLIRCWPWLSHNHNKHAANPHLSVHLLWWHLKVQATPVQRPQASYNDAASCLNLRWGFQQLLHANAYCKRASHQCLPLFATTESAVPAFVAAVIFHNDHCRQELHYSAGQLLWQPLGPSSPEPQPLPSGWG